MIKSTALYGIWLILIAFTLAPPSARAFYVPSPAAAEVFVNPTKLDPAAACSAGNINPERFASNYLRKSYSVKEKVKICKGIESFVGHSRKAAAKAGPDLSERLHLLWATFIDYAVRFIPLPEKMENEMFIASAAFPRKYRADRYQAAVFVPADRAGDDLFFYAFWHELQHIHDIKTAWQEYGRIPNYTLEFNGFYLASLLAEVYRPKSWSTGQPAFWKDEWKKLPPAEQHALRAAEIDRYIQKSAVLRDAWDKTRADYDFTRRQY